jgi:hypothetical protein
MKLVFNRSLTGKRLSRNKFWTIINRRRGFEPLFIGGVLSKGGWRTITISLSDLLFSTSSGEIKQVTGAPRHVVVSLTVTVDGTTRDIKVVEGLENGLNEKAVEAVSRFGSSVPRSRTATQSKKEITAEVTFHLY